MARVVAVEMTPELLGYLVTEGGEAHVKVLDGLPKGCKVRSVSLTESGMIRMIFEHESFGDVLLSSVPSVTVRYGSIQCTESWDTRYTTGVVAK